MTRSNSLDHAARLRVERTGCTYAQAYEMEELVAEEYEAERCYPDGYDTDLYDEDGPERWLYDE